MKSNVTMALFVFVALSVSSVIAQERESDSSATEVKVFHLKHASAGDVFHVVDALLSLPKETESQTRTRMAVDERMNSIVVTGTPDQLGVVAGLIKQVDVAKPRESLPKQDFFKAYKLNDEESLDQVFHLLQSMLSGSRSVKMDRDKGSLNIYLQGNEEQHAIAEKLIAQAKTAVKEQEIANPDVHVSIIWVVEGSQVDNAAALASLDENVQRVLANASKKGLLDFENPMVAARTTTLVHAFQRSTASFSRRNNNIQQQRVSGNSRGFFENFSKSKSGTFELAIGGNLELLPTKKYKLNSKLHLSVARGGKNASAADMASDIRLPLDHPVLLSFSTIAGIDSAVVIQLNEQ